MVQGWAKKFLLSSVTHVLSGLAGCASAALSRWVAWMREIQTCGNYFAPWTPKCYFYTGILLKVLFNPSIEPRTSCNVEEVFLLFPWMNNHLMYVYEVARACNNLSICTPFALSHCLLLPRFVWRSIFLRFLAVAAKGPDAECNTKYGADDKL